MNKTKHISAPWKAEGRHLGKGFAITSQVEGKGYSVNIANISTKNLQTQSEKREIANLIAAAPELLEALKEFQESIILLNRARVTESQTDEMNMRIAKALLNNAKAIAKAEGK